MTVPAGLMPLPLHVDRAEYEYPTLTLGGEGWSLSCICVWRWVNPEGRVVTGESPDACDLVWDLVGDEIAAVDWVGPASLGLDPRFRLTSGGSLDLLSDATFDTWVMRAPGVILVGPMVA
jgi:hypothetical protein